MDSQGRAAVAWPGLAPAPAPAQAPACLPVPSCGWIVHGLTAAFDSVELRAIHGAWRSCTMGASVVRVCELASPCAALRPIPCIGADVDRNSIFVPVRELIATVTAAMLTNRSATCGARVPLMTPTELHMPSAADVGAAELTAEPFRAVVAHPP